MACHIFSAKPLSEPVLTACKGLIHFIDFQEEDDDFEEEEHILGLDDLKKLGQKNQVEMESSKPEEIMESTQDAAEWKLEVERVMPQLKVTIRTDNKVSLGSRSQQ